VHQVRYLHNIHMEMIPFFDDDDLVRQEYE
jgi:hypothetical protein